MATAKQSGKLAWVRDESSYRAAPATVSPEVQTQIDLIQASPIPSSAKKMAIDAIVQSQARRDGFPFGLTVVSGRDAQGIAKKQIVEVSGGSVAPGGFEAKSFPVHVLRQIADNAAFVRQFLDSLAE